MLTIALIVYGSLYPWHLRPLPPGQTPIWILIHSWPNAPASLLIRDVAVNVIVYLPLGFFALTTFKSIWRSFVLGVALSVFAEFSQIFIVSRVPSLVDIASNTVGTALGIGIALLWVYTRHRHSDHPVSTLLVACWILYQCFPFIPDLRHASVHIWSAPQDVLLFLAEAVALAVVAKHKAAALLLIVPLKAVIYTRTLELSELACYAAAIVLARLVTISAAPASALLAAALLMHGFAPYHLLDSPNRFSWVFFQASFTAEWEPALTVMLGKIYPYAVLIWLIRESGVRLLHATLGVAVLLAGIEIAQIYLPGRAAEITDPALAVLLG